MATQLTGAPPTQPPFWQVSFTVQRLPSLHAVPLAFCGFEQTPVPTLQTPTSWQLSGMGQTTGLLPTQVPAWQTSIVVQALPSLHATPVKSVQVPLAVLPAAT